MQPEASVLDWKRDPSLPWVKYEKGDDYVDINELVNEIIGLLKVRHFKNYGAYEDEVGKYLETLWPNYMQYFCPVGMLMQFQRSIRNAIRERVLITFEPWHSA